MDDIDLTEQWGYWLWCPSLDDLKQTLCTIIDHMEQHIPPGYREHVMIIHRKPNADPFICDRETKASVGWRYWPPKSKAVEGITPPEGVLTQLSQETRHV